MGKPFDKEIDNIPKTLRWAFSSVLDSSFEDMISTLARFPLLVVGSGGSLSAAHFIARIHEKVTGKISRAITPLDLIFSPICPATHAVMFLSASGNNKDLLNAFEKATQREFAFTSIICASIGSKVVQKAKAYPHIKVFEYACPAGKDGFLAANSLLSTCILAGRAYKAIDISEKSLESLVSIAQSFQKRVRILDKNTIVALGGGWAWPALIDLESKFTETGLGNVQISDFRNFAHGRHNWFNSKGDVSTLLVLETPQLANLARKTLDLLPKLYSRTVLKSLYDGPLATIDLYIRVFHIVNEVGYRKSIDPGKPKIPEYGRRIYHLGLSPAYKAIKMKNRDIWVERKARVSNQSYVILKKFLDEFLVVLGNKTFAGIVFDYDGTLCDPPERFKQPIHDIGKALNDLLSKKIAISIATGRGHSVQESLRRVIKERYWAKVLIGNYNGAIVLPLSEDLPPCNSTYSKILRHAIKLIREDLLLMDHAKIEVRAKQISIIPKHISAMEVLFLRLSEILCKLKNVKIVRSDHSFDVLHPDVSKVNIVRDLLKTINGQNKNLLIVGDKGQCGGNDFELLSLPYSLSVDEVSSSPTSCWNLSPVGLRGAKATLSLIEVFEVKNKTFIINLDSLERKVSK